MSTRDFPHDKGIDHTLEVLLKEGYEYILNKKQALNTNVFATRLLGRKTICLSGLKGAELFYDNEKFERNGAMPNRILNTLFGQGGVQTLDNQAHNHRKELFMPLLGQEVIHDFHMIAMKQWEKAVDKWIKMDQIILYEESQEILTRIASEWLGVPVEDDDYPELAKDLSNMFEAAAKVGLQHHAGEKSRSMREEWLIDIVKDIRNRKIEISQDKMLYHFAWHRDLNKELLRAETVAVELLNILRPTVAVSIYINFIALALHDFPEQGEKLLTNDKNNREYFVQEVRRFYPFFPFAGARVKDDFIWEGYEFKKDTLTLLDLYGTNHDQVIWKNPQEFNPARFCTRKENKYDFIPQGGGEYVSGHRCPGELVTIEMMNVALGFLVQKITYQLPKQDLSYSMTEMPSMPKDKVILTNIQRQKPR